MMKTVCIGAAAISVMVVTFLSVKSCLAEKQVKMIAG